MVRSRKLAPPPIDRFDPSARRRMPPDLALFDQKVASVPRICEPWPGASGLQSRGARAWPDGGRGGWPLDRTPSASGTCSPWPPAGSHSDFFPPWTPRGVFFFRSSEHFHLVVGGASSLVGEWAPLLCHRLRDFLVEAGRKKKPAAPQGIPRRSPTPVLTGPCVA